MTESDNLAQVAQAQLRASVELPAEKKFYFNGYTVATSPADFAIVLLQNDQPIALLNTSHATAKSLMRQLEKAVTAFEDRLKQPIITPEEIAAAFSQES